MKTKLQSPKKTKILEEISSRIGSLSAPAKMPGYAWSIPAKYCITGSKLAKVDGTPCSVCYACKGRYAFANVMDAQERRLKGWYEDSDWRQMMSIRLLLLKEPYFRWFDSGDLQSFEMLEAINQIALDTQQTTEHWLPTQERAFVAKLNGAIAPNLVVRISSSQIGLRNKSKVLGTKSSSVVKYIDKQDSMYTDEYLCPSRDQKNECGSCRACWDKQIEHIIYRYH